LSGGHGKLADVRLFAWLDPHSGLCRGFEFGIAADAWLIRVSMGAHLHAFPVVRIPMALACAVMRM
jgi:hypothetical protein